MAPPRTHADRRRLLVRWGVPLGLWALWLALLAWHWWLVVHRGGMAEDASPGLQWVTSASENLQSEAWQLAMAATVVDVAWVAQRWYRAKLEE